ncbi:MAG TPA: PEP-CTERM sorting domain-containing protein [Fimbriimonadaceae bacterium]|nr:PEP-CTERM sorting domain-containing protein [Fimbriimonadaceae bacterium]
MRRFAISCIVLAGAAVGFGQTNPPSWWNQANADTVSLCFRFNIQSFPDFASPFNVPFWYGGSYFDPDLAPLWSPVGSFGDPSRQGIIRYAPGEADPARTEIRLNVDNDARLSEFSFFWIQFDYRTSGNLPNANNVIPSAGSDLLSIDRSTNSLADGWTRYTLTGLIGPAPDFEELSIILDTTGTPTGQTRQAAIDNLCFGTFLSPVPEPATLAGLGLASLALIVRRRRRN